MRRDNIFYFAVLCCLIISSINATKTKKTSSLSSEQNYTYSLTSSEVSGTTEDEKYNKTNLPDEVKSESMNNKEMSTTPLSRSTKIGIEKNVQRQAVKLSMKQGLFMNQILNIYALDNVENLLCKNHTEEFKIGMRAMEPWALKMFDSSSKLPSGVLEGNLYEFGTYKQCLGIFRETPYGPIYGKSCTLQITPRLWLIKKILSFRNVTEEAYKKVDIMVKQAAVYFTVCVPHSCPVDDIFRHFNKNLIEMTNGLDLTVSLKEQDCSSIHDSLPWGMKEIISLSLLSISVVLVIIATICEYLPNAKNSVFMDLFSATTNFKRIIAPGDRKSCDYPNLQCLQGIRFLTSCYVLIGHRYLETMFFPSVNALEPVEWIKHYASSLIIGATVTVDTFFLISAVLTSYYFFQELKHTGKCNLLNFYLRRYLRITIPLAVVILVYATLVQHFGSGPLWHTTYKGLQLPCQYFWWSSLLYIQAYINPGTLCIVQTWSLGPDMIYYFISPVILYPIWKRPKFGLALLSLWYCASVAIIFYFAWIKQYPGGIPITGQLLGTDFFQYFYIAPHNRMAPSIIGLGLGYAIFKNQDTKMHISRTTSILGWITSLVTLFIVVVSSHIFNVEGHQYNRLEASLYLAFSRSVWTFALSWVIWACAYGYGGIVDSVLSSYTFRVLGRLSYAIFLLHMLFQFVKGGSAQTPIHFSDFDTLYMAAGDFCFVLLGSFLFCIFYELPYIRLAGFLFAKNNAANQVRPVSPKSKSG